MHAARKYLICDILAFIKKRAESLISQHSVRNPRIAQLNVGICIGTTGNSNLLLQRNLTDLIEPNRIHPGALPFSYDHTCCSLYPLPISCQTLFKAISGNTPSAIAAHFAYAAVRVKKAHSVIAALLWKIYRHKPVSANRKPSSAKAFRQITQLFRQ